MGQGKHSRHGRSGKQQKAPPPHFPARLPHDPRQVSASVTPASRPVITALAQLPVDSVVFGSSREYLLMTQTLDGVLYMAKTQSTYTLRAVFGGPTVGRAYEDRVYILSQAIREATV